MPSTLQVMIPFQVFRLESTISSLNDNVNRFLLPCHHSSTLLLLAPQIKQPRQFIIVSCVSVSSKNRQAAVLSIASWVLFSSKIEQTLQLSIVSCVLFQVRIRRYNYQNIPPVFQCHLPSHAWCNPSSSSQHSCHFTVS